MRLDIIKSKSSTWFKNGNKHSSSKNGNNPIATLVGIYNTDNNNVKTTMTTIVQG